MKTVRPVREDGSALRRPRLLLAPFLDSRLHWGTPDERLGLLLELLVDPGESPQAASVTPPVTGLAGRARDYPLAESVQTLGLDVR